MRDAAGHFTIDEIAADALALADTLDFATFSIVGHSMGAMAAEKVAVIAPGACARWYRSRLCLAAACRSTRRNVRYSERAADHVADRRTIIDRSTGGRLPASWVEWKAAYSAARSSPPAFGAYFRAWADTDFGDEIAGIHPVKVLIGEHDPAFDAALMARTYLRRYPLATVDVLRNAGHYPMNETPLAFVAAMEAFLLAVTANPVGNP